MKEKIIETLSVHGHILYDLFVTWASLVAWMVKRLPTMWETRVRSLGWEDPLERK